MGVTLSKGPCTHMDVTLSPWSLHTHGHHVVRGSLPTHGCHLVPGSLHTHGHHLVPKVPMYTQMSPCPHGRYTHTDVTLSQGPHAHTDITLHRHPPPNHVPLLSHHGDNEEQKILPASPVPVLPATTACLRRPAAAWPRARGSARAAVPSRSKSQLCVLQPGPRLAYDFN